MIQLKDLKNYHAYLPIKEERNQIIQFIYSIIGNTWNKNFWQNKFNHNDYIIRYRYGNKNIVQIYLKNKKWYNIPINIWIDCSSLNKDALSPSTIQWIHNEKLKLQSKYKNNSDFLSI